MGSWGEGSPWALEDPGTSLALHNAPSLSEVSLISYSPPPQALTACAPALVAAQVEPFDPQLVSAVESFGSTELHTDVPPPMELDRWDRNSSDSTAAASRQEGSGTGRPAAPIPAPTRPKS